MQVLLFAASFAAAYESETASCQFAAAFAAANESETASFSPTFLGTPDFLEALLSLPLPLLAMYECPKLVLATKKSPDCATCVIS